MRLVYKNNLEKCVIMHKERHAHDKEQLADDLRGKWQYDEFRNLEHL